MPPETKVGLRLRKARGRMSQEKLAQEVGVSRNTIYAWETTGRLPYGRTVRDVSRALTVSADYLLGLDEEPWPRWAPTPEEVAAEKIADLAGEAT